MASLLFFDVSGAFNNVLYQRLLYNLRKRRIDEKIVQWIESFLKDRHTNILIDVYKFTRYVISMGIPQGSPFSPILYLFYNADLIKNCNTEANITITGYIDNMAILAIRNTIKETCNIMQTTLGKAQY